MYIYPTTTLNPACGQSPCLTICRYEVRVAGIAHANTKLAGGGENMDNREEFKRTLGVGQQLSFEPEQLTGKRLPYVILSIDGQLVKVSTAEGFRLLPIAFLHTCAQEGRLRVEK